MTDKINKFKNMLKYSRFFEDNKLSSNEAISLYLDIRGFNRYSQDDLDYMKSIKGVYICPLTFCYFYENHNGTYTLPNNPYDIKEKDFDFIIKSALNLAIEDYDYNFQFIKNSKEKIASF